jgi:hypothetical protein
MSMTCDMSSLDLLIAIRRERELTKKHEEKEECPRATDTTICIPSIVARSVSDESA